MLNARCALVHTYVKNKLDRGNKTQCHTVYVAAHSKLAIRSFVVMLATVESSYGSLRVLAELHTNTDLRKHSLDSGVPFCCHV